MTLLINASNLNTFDQISLNKQLIEIIPQAVFYSLTFYTADYLAKDYHLQVTQLKQLFPRIQITLKSKINGRTVYTKL